MKYKFIVIVTAIILVAASASVFLMPISTPLLPTRESPLSVVDDMGRIVTVKGNPERIVSLSPANTEILFALGLGEKVVGVTRYCDYPPEVKDLVAEGKISSVGGFADPSVEKVVGLNPELVVASAPIQNEIVQTLENNGLTVMVLNAKDVDGILNDIRLVGKITGKISEAERLAADMRLRIDAVSSKTAQVSVKPRVYYEVWNDPLMSVGSQSFLNELIDLAGGVNIFFDSAEEYPIVSSEAVVSRNPQVIIVSVGYMGGAGEDNIKVRSGWNIVEAVGENRIYEIEEDTVFRAGPRIVDGLEALAKSIHPELFP